MWLRNYACPRDGHLFVHYEFENWDRMPRHCLMCGTAEHRDKKER